MKREIFLFVITLLFAISSFAQQEFAPIGATWTFPETYFFSPNTGIIQFTNTGDTIIQSTPCKVISKSHQSCYIPSGDYFFHQSNDSVYLYNETLQLFELLYAFDAEVGDSWTFSASDGLWGDTMTCLVDSISYFNISSTDSLRIQHVTLQSEDFFINGTDTIFASYATKLIENIGFELALLPIQFLTICDSNYERELRCYEDNEVGLINFSNVACLTTSIVEPSDFSNLSVYPNPTYNSFFIKNKNTNKKNIHFQLLDFQGITVLKKETTIFPNQNLEVPTHHLPTGIYFLKIENQQADKNQNNTFTIQKIIISR